VEPIATDRVRETQVGIRGYFANPDAMLFLPLSKKLRVCCIALVFPEDRSC
jgi:hypothetical protein